jgi:SAM-dependent methyltransferase
MADPTPDPRSVSDPRYWADRYAEGTARWDLGGPCPVFVHLLSSPQAPPPGHVGFPGCGSGHDVRYWREQGYDAVGFDFAVQSDDPPVKHLDVFELGRRHPESFDTIVEYTCYCAIDPARRAEYAASLRAALKPGGTLVALLFPVEHKPEGPPFGISDDEIESVLGAGLELVHFATPVQSAEGREGRERLAIFRKPRGEPRD